MLANHRSESGDAGGSENPGVGGSIPSQPTISLSYLPISKFGFVTKFVTNSGTLQRIPAQEETAVDVAHHLAHKNSHLSPTFTRDGRDKPEGTANPCEPDRRPALRERSSPARELSD